jgi:hypothetical protein
MAAAPFQSLLAEHVAQHAAARERIVHVQFVDAPHQKQIGVRDWTWMVVHRGTADLSNSSACLETGNAGSGSIIALRSANPP